MKRIRKYFLPLLTLLCMILGAALPGLTAQIQDIRLNQRSESLALNVASLTLKQDASIGEVLRMFSDMAREPLTVTAIAGAPTPGNASSAGSSWEGEMRMSEEEVRLAAMEAIDALDRAGLILKADRAYLDSADFNARPLLQVAGNSEPVRVWECFWEGHLPHSVTLDDMTGKAVQIIVGSFEAQGYELPAADQLERWILFLRDYYGIEVIDIAEDFTAQKYDKARFSCLLIADLEDGLEPCELSLKLYDNAVVFN